MNENNFGPFNESEFRIKRTEKEYNNRSNQKILLSYDFEKNEKRKLEFNKDNMNLNFNKEKDNNDLEIANEYQNDLNINSYEPSNNIETNKYPNFQSFLQLTPKENIEIPLIKYYNFIFNIGAPSN